MTYALGVDLGTTFSAAAVATGDGIRMVDLGGRAGAVASVVYHGPDGAMLVGEAAERRSASEPDRVAREVKRRLGDPVPIVLGGVPFSVESVMAATLREIVRLVSERQGEAPALVCLTHPANWGAYRRELFGQVAEIAELPNVHPLTEPAAAALWHARDDRDGGEPVGSTLVVYDLGGGTFDAVVLRRTGDGFELLGEPRGLEHLGGLNFDAALFGIVDEALDGAISALDPADPASVMTMTRLRAELVQAKEVLSVDVAVSVPVPTPTGWQEVRVTRREFERRIEPLVEQTIDTLDATLATAGLAPDDVSSVLLVGGSSRVPLVAALVRRRLTVATRVDEHPKDVVALGAALHARRLLDSPTVEADTPPAPAPVAPAPPAPAPVAPAPVAPAPRTESAVGSLLTLVILGGEEGGRRVPLVPGRVAVGRDPGPAGILLRDRHASRSHAHLQVSADASAARLIDNASMNGTFVDGRPIDDVVLEPGHFVRMGTTLAVVLNGPPPPASAAMHAGAGATVQAPPSLRRAGRGGPAESDRGRFALPPLSRVEASGSRFRRRPAPPSYMTVLASVLDEVGARHGQTIEDRRRRSPSSALAPWWGPGTLWAAGSARVTVGFADQPSELRIDLPDGLGGADLAAVEEALEPFTTDADVPVELPLASGMTLDVVGRAAMGRGVANEIVVQLASRYGPSLVDFAAMAGTVDPPVEPWVAGFCATAPDVVTRLGDHRRSGSSVAVALLHGDVADVVVADLARIGAVIVRIDGRRPLPMRDVVTLTVDDDSGLAMVEGRDAPAPREVVPATLGAAGLSLLS